MSDIANVFIVDDDASVRGAISMLLDAAGYIAAPFARAEEFLDICNPDTEGCIILDVNMPDMDGPTLQKELSRRNLHLPIIFLTGQGTIPLTVRALKAGAMDFLTKPVMGEVLLARVQEALQQHAEMRKQAKVTQSINARLASLTDREREVMMLAVAGRTSKEIAKRLNISYRTVEIHRAHVIQKTGTTNMLELARLTSQQAPP